MRPLGLLKSKVRLFHLVRAPPRYVDLLALHGFFVGLKTNKNMVGKLARRFPAQRLCLALQRGGAVPYTHGPGLEAFVKWVSWSSGYRPRRVMTLVDPGRARRLTLARRWQQYACRVTALSGHLHFSFHTGTVLSVEENHPFVQM